MTARDVLLKAAERGSDASHSVTERKDLVKMVRTFNRDLLAQIQDGDLPGVLALTYVFRAGKGLGPGVVLTLQDRALVGWMKGFLKKPTIAALPLSSISSVERGTKGPSGRIPKPTPALLVKAQEEWEFLCSPDVPADAPLYGMLVSLLDGTLKPEQLSDDGLEPAAG